MTQQSNLAPVQDPVIRSHSLLEAIFQFLMLGVTVAASYWLFGFEISLLVALVVGFTLNTMNVIASATSTNVQIAEVRDWLKKEVGLRGNLRS